MASEDVAELIHNSQLDAFSLYQIIQDTPSRNPSPAGPALPALGHALAGALATASTKCLLYPLELVTTRLQVQRQLRNEDETESAAKDADAEYKGLFDAVRKIYRAEGGLKAFYTGCLPDVGKGIVDSFIFFLAYTIIRQVMLKRQDDRKKLSIPKELSVGILAGTLSKLVTTPIQNIVTRQQTAALVAARNPSSTNTPETSHQLTMKDIALQIRSERGLAGFWTGYSASIILTLNPAITFAVDNLLQNALPKSRQEDPGWKITFLIAAISKAVATSVTYPVMLAKSRAQALSPSPEAGAEGTEKTRDSEDGLWDPERKVADPDSAAAAHLKTKSTAKKAFRLVQAQKAMFLSLMHIYKAEGLTGLYSGLSAEVLKGFLSHGITMTVKDQAHIGVIEAYYLLLRLTEQWPAKFQQAGKDAVDGAEAVASDVGERAENVGVTLAEGAKQIIVAGKDLVRGQE